MCLTPDYMPHIFSPKQVPHSQCCTYSLKNTLKLYMLGYFCRVWRQKQDANHEYYSFPCHSTSTEMAFISFYIICSRDTFRKLSLLRTVLQRPQVQNKLILQKKTLLLEAVNNQQNYCLPISRFAFCQSGSFYALFQICVKKN